MGRRSGRRTGRPRAPGGLGQSVGHAGPLAGAGQKVALGHHASTSADDVCYLQDLYTEPTVRGQGVGRALVAAVTDLGARRGCSRIYWPTHQDNEAARRLYDTVGQHRGFIRYEIPLD